MEKELEAYALHVVQSDKKDRMRIDFKIFDDHNTFCTEVFGDAPNDVEIVCEHPVVEFDDDEHVGECPICGAWATWHWQESVDDGYVIKEQVVDSWMPQKQAGGIIGKHLQEVAEDGNGAI